MADFIYGTQLNLEVELIISNAKDYLLLISPYIKLHDRIKAELKRQKQNDKLRIIVVFGKSENESYKNISAEDIATLKEFPNVKICYEQNLHAKYFANETASLIASMNPRQYSQNTNVEVGILMKQKPLAVKALTEYVSGADAGEKAATYFEDVVNNSELLFEKVPGYDNGIFGFNKSYTGSSVKVDKLYDFFKEEEKPAIAVAEPIVAAPIITPPQVVEEIVVVPEPQPILAPATPLAAPQPQTHYGYCIRTGVPIPFNPEIPMSYPAYKEWHVLGNADYPEKFCHYSGEPSNGETSVNKPIMRKNWFKAKDVAVV